MKSVTRTHLMASSMWIGIAGTICLAPSAFAQEAPQTGSEVQRAEEAEATGDTIVVTGSRIRRSDTQTSAPVSVIGEQDLLDRGFVQAGEALNRLTSITPITPVAIGDGSPAGSGQQFPNLFNLGPGRTLTLINGRRAAASAQGQGERVVDTNTIPTGLIKSIEIVQAGGAAVYGSDAIAGVVNYILKDDFDGLTIDLQNGTSSRKDFMTPSIRLTAGKNFAGGRGNIAANFEYSNTPPLLFGSRPITNPVVRTLSNPLNTSLTDGIPARTPVVDPHFWQFNSNGVLFGDANTFAIRNLLGFRVTGQNIGGYQFSPDGQSVIPYNAGRRYVPGFNCSYPFCEGGDGLAFGELTSLFSGVERYSASALGHYDLSDRLKLSGEFNYSRSVARDPYGTQLPQPLTMEITRDNPYLTSNAIAQIAAVMPGFAAGDPVYLEKVFNDLLPTREFRFTTETYRGVVALDGDFDIGDRNFYYGAFYSHSVVQGRTSAYGVSFDRLNNAANAARNGAGQIVCAINADADPTNNDAACVPLNPFGINQTTAAGRAYTTISTGEAFTNRQHDFLASLGGDLVALPAGNAKFSIAYEHRAESARFTPSAARQAGDAFGTPELPSSGRYNTDEFAAELLIPVVGGDFTLPLVKVLEVTGQYRHVDNSIAGKENVWGVGARWEVGGGLTLRGSRSRNFRAPTLNQLLAPQTTALGGGIADPCDARVIDSGPAPTTRRANCRALFAANPGYGPLAGFQQEAFNSTVSTQITSGGNPDLRNEISNTTTFGLVWQPSYVPGNLTVTADRVQIDLKDGITAFDPTNFAQACFDASPQPADICSTFTRNGQGTIITALNTVYNAASVRYRGEIYRVNYRFPLSWIVGSSNNGSLEFDLEATHNETLETIVAGVTTRTAGTTSSPDWVFRGTARLRMGPMQISYELYRLPQTKVSVFDTIENTPFPIIPSNTRHSISATYDVTKNYQIRAGVNNFTDKGPSFPSLTYGDIIGRTWFVGARASF